MKTIMLCTMVLLGGCEKANDCPEMYDWERQEFEACEKRADCTLSHKQVARLAEERIACKNGPTSP